MPSRFAALIRGVAKSHESHFAADVSLTQAGSTITTPAVIHKSRADSRVIDGSTVIITTRLVRFTAIDTLRDDATVTIDDEVWSVESIHHYTTGIGAQLVRTAMQEPARKGFRR
jgi:hypothetical protein